MAGKLYEMGIPAETRSGAQEWDQKLQSYRADVGDVDMVCNREILRLEHDKELRNGRCTWEEFKASAASISK